MKNLIICTICVVFSTLSLSAQDLDYYIIKNDTTFCKNLSYSVTSQGYLSRLKFTNLEGEKIEIEGRDKVADVSTIKTGNLTKDRIPQKTNKPDGYVKWVDRIVDGKLKVYFYSSTMSTSGPSGSTTSIVKFYIKMPDGTYYDINKKSDRTKYIIPYLKNCSEFTQLYTGNYSKNKESFVKTIELYNETCM